MSLHKAKVDPQFDSTYDVSDQDGGLSFGRRRRRQRSPLVLPCLVVGAGICMVGLTAMVIYLEISNCFVQKRLTAVQVQLTITNERLNYLTKEHLELYSHGSQKRTFEVSRISKLPSLTDVNQNLSAEQNLKSELHIIRKRDVSVTDTKSSRSKKNSDRNFSDSTELKETKHLKRAKRDINKRLDNLMKDLKSLKANYRRDLSHLGHPSAHMVLPLIPEDDNISIEEHFSADNGIKWTTVHNALFETEDWTHFTVKTPGAYFVYLQVTYQGQERRKHPTCSHIVMCENPKYNRTKLLLYGSTTQYNLGGLIRVATNGDEIKAIDSVHVSGVFQLMSDDRLYVKPDDVSNECVVSVFKDKTFFGAFRLQSSFQELS